MRLLWIGFSALVLTVNVQAANDVTMIDQLIAQKKYDDALKQIDQSLATDPNQPQQLFLRARTLAASGKTMQAIEQYKSLIEKYPGQPEPYNNLAAIYVRQGKPDEAQQLLDQAMLTHPGYAAVYKNLSTLYVERARSAYGKALQLTEQKSIQLDPVAQLYLRKLASTKPQKNNAIKQNKAADSHKTAMIFQGDKNKTDKKGTNAGISEVPSSRQHAAAIETMQGWARAWSAKDAKAYIDYYTATYAPAGVSRSDWIRQRHDRINKPKQIKVSISNVQVYDMDKQSIRIQLQQDYESDRYHDLSRKEFLLAQQNGKWKIYKERSLGFVTP